MDITFWNAPLFTIQAKPVSAMNLLTFVLTLFLSLLIDKGVRRGVAKIGVLQHIVSLSALYGIGRLAYYVILLIGIYIAMTMIGIDLSGIAMIIGALGVGIGFGLQSIFNNFFAGIIILFEKKVSIYDLIQLESGDIGVVIEINVRSTVMRTPDNRKIVIPNTEIISKRVSKWNQGEDHLSRLRLPFSVERAVEKETVRQVVIEVARSLATTYQNLEPDVWLSKVSEETQEFEMVVWVSYDDVGLRSYSLSASYLWALENSFAKKGIKLITASRTLSTSSLFQEL